MSEVTLTLGQRKNPSAMSGDRSIVLRRAGFILLVAAVAIAAAMGEWTEFWSAWLTNWLFAISIGLGALLFVLIQHITKAGWSVVVRRVAEVQAVTMGPLALFAAPFLIALLLGSHSLFEWNDHHHMKEDEILAGKSVWLNAPFFAARTVVYLAIWFWIGRRCMTVSTASDSASGIGLQSLRSRSGPYLIVLGLTITLASFDWIMSLDPHWFSSILGVYLFASAITGGLAVLTLTALALRRRGSLPEFSIEHQHDLGKLLFGFNCFWAYIAFSQYLLIWYANIPEETSWFADRQAGHWSIISGVLIVVHFVAPFFGLMSRHAKRNTASLVFWSSLIVLACWLDFYWLIVPTVRGLDAVPGLLDLLTFAGFVAVGMSAFVSTAGSYNLVPRNDPLLAESLSFHNT